MAFDFNGHLYDYAHIRFAFGGNTDVKGIKGFSYYVNRESPNLYGTGSNPVGYGRSNKQYEGELTLMRHTVEAIRASVQQKLGDLSADLTDMPATDIILELGSESMPTKKHVIRAVRFTRDGMEGNSGDPELPLTIPVMFAGLQLGPL